MSRLLAVTAVLVLLSNGIAAAQLSIVQQWPIDVFPGGVCYDPDLDHLWIVTDSTNEVREYTRDGTFVGMWDGSLAGLEWPIGIDYAPSTQHLWICDEFNPEQVVECTKTGTPVSSFSVDADMQDAVGLAYNPDNDHLYVADDNANEVVEWTTSGTFVARWSTAPDGDSDAICCLGSANTLLLGDDNGATVYEFTLDGTLLNTYDMSALLGIQGVEGLSYDPLTGNVFLGDSTSGAGRIIYEISGFGPPVAVEATTWGGIKSQFK